MSSERRRRLVEIARERELLVVEDNPYGLLRFEGEPLEPLYALDGGDYVLLPRHVLEDPLARDPARLALRAAAGDGEGRARQAGVGPLHLDPDPVLRRRVLRRGALARLRRRACRRSIASGATRCSRRSSATSPPQATWTRPEGGLFIWATLPDYIDTTDLLAKALRENVAFVPGAAAYVDGRGGSSMRLNFSGIDRGRDPRGDPADRQGRLASRSTCSSRSPASTKYRTFRPPPGIQTFRPPPRLRVRGRTGQLRVGRRGARSVARAVKVAVLKGGRGLERQVSLRSGARVEDALALARSRGGARSTSAPTWSRR